MSEVTVGSRWRHGILPCEVTVVEVDAGSVFVECVREDDEPERVGKRWYCPRAGLVAAFDRIDEPAPTSDAVPVGSKWRYRGGSFDVEVLSRHGDAAKVRCVASRDQSRKVGDVWCPPAWLVVDHYTRIDEAKPLQWPDMPRDWDRISWRALTNDLPVTVEVGNLGVEFDPPDLDHLRHSMAAAARIDAERIELTLHKGHLWANVVGDVSEREADDMYVTAALERDPWSFTIYAANAAYKRGAQ